MKRITGKVLIRMVNELFKKLEISNFECYAIDRTYFTSEQYQNGACYLYLRFRDVNDPYINGTFLCFYPMYTIQEYLNTGEYELFLYFNSGRYTSYSLEEAELNIRKK